MKSMLKRMLAAVFALTLVMATSVLAAETSTFEFTEAVYSTCNNDLTVIDSKETITTEVTERISENAVKKLSEKGY
jgi:hypothetical protein